MCTCSSCEATDKFAGWDMTPIGWPPKPPLVGFANWPRGNPAGPAASKRDYAAHWPHCGAAFNRKPDPLRSAFPCTGINGPLPQPLRVVADWIAKSYADPLYTAQAWQDGMSVRKRTPSRLAQLAQQYRKAA